MKQLQSKAGRARLEPRAKPYWSQLTIGRFLGYRRRPKKAGTWIARVLIAKRQYLENVVATADDDAPADGGRILSFEDAVELAQDWCSKQLSPQTGHQKYSVNHCMQDYVSYLRAEGKVSADVVDGSRRLYVEPHRIGERLVKELSTRELREWRAWVARQPRTHRTAGKKEPFDEEARRRRKATANRVTSQLKAALNLAYQEGVVQSKDAWQRLKPIKGVESVRVWFLRKEEIPLFVSSCKPEAFRMLAKGGLLTGCRYGELTRLRVEDYDQEARAVFVERTKSSHSRYVYLNDEGAQFFDQQTTGRSLGSFMFEKEQGRPWRKGEQRRPFQQALERAGIAGGTFHGLRHTFASQLIMAGVSSHVVAALLGHTTPRMVEKHYGHLAPNHVKLVARDLMPRFGIVEDSIGSTRL